MTLDVASQELGEPTSSPPKKKHKARDIVHLSSSLEPSLPEVPARKSKKKQKPRIPSSGSVADLSSNVAHSPPPANITGKQSERGSGSRVSKPKGSEHDLPPQEILPSAQALIKTKKKRKAVANSPDASSRLSPSTAETPQPVQKKRTAVASESADEPRTKKAKQNKDPASAAIASTSTSTGLMPVPPASEPAEGNLATKRKKKSKKGDIVGGTEQKTSKSAEVVSPAASDVRTKGEKKKLPNAPAAQPNDETRKRNVQDEAPPSKKTKSKPRKTDEQDLGNRSHTSRSVLYTKVDASH